MNDEPKTPLRTGQGMDYGEQADVQQVHAAVQREKREPRVGAEPLSIWLIAVYGLAIFFGGAYLGRYSGNFITGGLDPMGSPPAPKRAVAGGPSGGEQAELSPRDRGKKIFAANCQTCHQANGLGVAGHSDHSIDNSQIHHNSTCSSWRLGHGIVRHCCCRRK